MRLVADLALHVVVPATRALEPAGLAVVAMTLQHGDGAEVALDRGHQVPALGKRVVPRAVGALGRRDHAGGGARGVVIAPVLRQVAQRPRRKRPVALALEEVEALPGGGERQVALEEPAHADVPAHALVGPGQAAVVQMMRCDVRVQPESRGEDGLLALGDGRGRGRGQRFGSGLRDGLRAGALSPRDRGESKEKTTRTGDRPARRSGPSLIPRMR